MTTASGFDSQVAYAKEIVSGTYTAPTRAIEHVKFTGGLKRNDFMSKGIKAGRRRNIRTHKGLQWADFTLEHELSGAYLGVPLTQLAGTVVTTGAGPYQHVLTDGPKVETQACSIQVGKPDGAGNVNPHSYIGCQLVSAKIGVKAAAEYASFAGQWYGQHLDLAQTLVTPTYSSAWAPWSYLETILQIGGAEYEFESVDLEFKTGIKTGRHAARTTTPERPRISKESGQREATVTITSEHYANTILAAAIAGTEQSFQLTFLNSASDKLVITGNLWFDIPDPDITGIDIPKDTFNARFQSATSDAAALTFTLTNSDSVA